jgi:NADH-quinone oxidoreductase subunit J
LYGYRQKATDAVVADIRTVGKQMLSIEAGGYALPFEMVSILLLASMVACIAIAMKLPDSKTTNTLK